MHLNQCNVCSSLDKGSSFGFCCHLRLCGGGPAPAEPPHRRKAGESKMVAGRPDRHCCCQGNRYEQHQMRGCPFPRRRLANAPHGSQADTTSIQTLQAHGAVVWKATLCFALSSSYICGSFVHLNTPLNYAGLCIICDLCSWQQIQRCSRSPQLKCRRVALI